MRRRGRGEGGGGGEGGAGDTAVPARGRRKRCCPLAPPALCCHPLRQRLLLLSHLADLHGDGTHEEEAQHVEPHAAVVGAVKVMGCEGEWEAVGCVRVRGAGGEWGGVSSGEHEDGLCMRIGMRIGMSKGLGRPGT